MNLALLQGCDAHEVRAAMRPFVRILMRGTSQERAAAKPYMEELRKYPQFKLMFFSLLDDCVRRSNQSQPAVVIPLPRRPSPGPSPIAA